MFQAFGIKVWEHSYKLNVKNLRFQTEKDDIHALCTQCWHDLPRKAMMFSHNDNWCSYTCPNKTKRCKLDGKTSIHH
jgi:heterodisulfide reductase subunit B